MNFKQVAKRVLPPIATDAIRSLLKQKDSQGPVEWEYIPNGWRTTDSNIKGWNVESILESQKAKWPEFLRIIQGNEPLGVSHESPVLSDNNYSAHNTLMAYAYALSLAASGKAKLSMLDWGGGIGHYCVISKALLPEVEIDYSCKDVPLLCQGGREFLPEAKFYDNEEDCFAKEFDFVLASGSVHYSENWKKVVKQLASVSRSYLYITRLPIVHQAASFVVVQRPYLYGYHTEYLCWFLNRDEFLKYMCDLKMELVREFLIQEKPYVVGAPEQCEYRGFLFAPQQDRKEA